MQFPPFPNLNPLLIKKEKKMPQFGLVNLSQLYSAEKSFNT